MVRFHTRLIGASLVDELKVCVARGDSAILLGPRYSGKRFLLQRLLERLLQDHLGPVVSVRLLNGSDVSHLDQIPYEVMTDSGAEVDQAIGNPIDRAASLHRKCGKPIILTVSNVDALPHHLARIFLERLRARVEGREVVAVLSGELDFRNLVHGPHSEFNCADQFVIQGFEKTEFTQLLREYSTGLNVNWNEDVEAELWYLTGGNVYLMRLLVATEADRQSRFADGRVGRVDAELMARAIRTDSVPAVHGSQILRHALIKVEPDCWEDLETLLETGTVPDRRGDGSPSALELSGIAVRREREIHFASPMMAAFARRYYNPRRIGDLYAKNRQWEKAFQCYERLDYGLTIRPFDSDDVTEVEPIVHALAAAMYTSAQIGADSVLALFTRAARYLLGFGEVSYWERTLGKAWLQSSDYHPVSMESVEEISAALASGETSRPGLLSLPDSMNRIAVAAKLRGGRPDQQCALVLSDFVSRTVLSSERRILVEELLEHFSTAHLQAVDSTIRKQRLATRNRHVEILNSLFDSIGGPSIDVKQILKLTAAELRTLGYQRVLLCLVDAGRERIVGVLDDCSLPSADLTGATNFQLSDPEKDIQPHVICTGRSRIVPDPANEPLISDAYKNQSMRPLAVVAILDREHRAVGTIHVERADGAVPTKEEVEDLELFGRQLAGILEQSERVTLIQKSLDKLPTPLFIVNSKEEICYLNRPGADLADMTAGWQTTPSRVQRHCGELSERFAESLQHRAVHQIGPLGTEGFRGEVLGDTLKDWRTMTLGGVVHLTDQRYLHKVFEAIVMASQGNDTPSALKALLDAVGHLGYSKARLYRIDSNSGHFVSALARGHSPEHNAKFERGEVLLPRQDEVDQHSWKCIERREPMVFSWRNDLPDWRVFYTNRGLEATNLKRPDCPTQSEKKQNSFWVDVPLFVDGKPFGKLALDCDPNLRPEEFEMLRVLMTQAESILLAARGREKREEEERITATKAGLEASMACVAHNLGSRYASLSLILERYRLREGKFPILRKINDDFGMIVRNVEGTLKRTKDLLTRLEVHRSGFDLGDVVTRVLESSLPKSQFKSPKSELFLVADRYLIETALVELIQNSRRFAPDHNRLRVAVRFDICDSGLGVKIIYEDNGPGIPAEHKVAVFEEFFTHHPGGSLSTGLGLAFVRRAVEAHGGSVHEDGTHGGGVRFVLQIPVPPISTEPQTKEEALCVATES